MQSYDNQGFERSPTQISQCEFDNGYTDSKNLSTTNTSQPISSQSSLTKPIRRFKLAKRKLKLNSQTSTKLTTKINQTPTTNTLDINYADDYQLSTISNVQITSLTPSQKAMKHPQSTTPSSLPKVLSQLKRSKNQNLGKPSQNPKIQISLSHDNSFSNLQSTSSQSNKSIQLPLITTSNPLTAQSYIDSQELDNKGTQCNNTNIKTCTLSNSSSKSLNIDYTNTKVQRYKDKLSKLAQFKLQSLQTSTTVKNRRLDQMQQKFNLKDKLRQQLLLMYQNRQEQKYDKLEQQQQQRSQIRAFKQELREKMKVEKNLITLQIQQKGGKYSEGLSKYLEVLKSIENQ